MPYARDTLEAAYKALHDDLGFEAEMPIRVELYRSPSDLAAVPRCRRRKWRARGRSRFASGRA